MSSSLVFHHKIHLIHSADDTVAIAELKVWRIPVSIDFPEGTKYSMFLVEKSTGLVLVGFDNHKPKGPHIHLREKEIEYTFTDSKNLINDFWKYTKMEGYYL